MTEGNVSESGLNFCSIGFWGYVAVCVQLYCRWFTVLHLVVAVLHYMFRPTWPSSGVYDVSLSYSWRKLLCCLCCLFLHVFILCTFPFVFFVNFLILVCVFACLPFLVVCRFCVASFLQEYKSKTSYTREDGHVCRNMYCKTTTTKCKTVKHVL
jgi:hypothetical protein